MGRIARFSIFGAMAATAIATVHVLSSGAVRDGSAAAAPQDRPQSSGAAQPADTTLRAELNAMRGAVQQLGRVQADLQRDVDRTATERDAAEAARESAEEAARIEAEDPTAADREAAELAARSDAKMSSESVDREWSGEKSEHFAAFFARPPLTGTRLTAVDCRTTMCRMELAHTSDQDRERFIQSFSDLAGPTGMVFAYIESEDDLEVEVYVTRDGVGLP